MKIALFYHSLVSDWNHGNAHFLRGVATELLAQGHRVKVYEPRDGWSRRNLVAHYGTGPLDAFAKMYPRLRSLSYDLDNIDLDIVLGDVDLVIVHEWNEPELVQRIGQHRRKTGAGYVLLFHDTHHRSMTAPREMSRYDLRDYDGVLAYGQVIRDMYLEYGWAPRAWTWHEAADVRVFKSIETDIIEGDAVWIGNWGDEERTEELHEFLLGPVRRLRLRAAAYGVRYPDGALDTLRDAGVRYHGWLPNYKVPVVFSRFRVTFHIPRRPYASALPGIPTIRPFEALACGIPMISAPWSDSEHLFTPGKDFLMARNGREMEDYLRTLLHEPALARELASHGRATVLRKHTCAHRVDELMSICATLGLKQTDAAAA